METEILTKVLISYVINSKWKSQKNLNPLCTAYPVGYEPNFSLYQFSTLYGNEYLVLVTWRKPSKWLRNRYKLDLNRRISMYQRSKTLVQLGFGNRQPCTNILLFIATSEHHHSLKKKGEIMTARLQYTVSWRTTYKRKIPNARTAVSRIICCLRSPNGRGSYWL